MNRLFLRFAALVLLAMTLASAVIYLTFRLLFGEPLEQIARRQAAAQIFLLEQYIDQAPADEWLTRLNKVREVSGVTLELQALPAALAALPARQHGALLRGEVVMDVAGRAYYRRVDSNGMRYIGSDADVIHAQHLPIDIGEALSMEAIRFALVTLFLLVPIGWWSRRHWRDLQALSRMADAFGRGDLSTRADAQRSASIAPLAGCINEMADRIAALLEARKHLLHSVSHELRTPIARLEFGLELLRDRHAGVDAELQRRLRAMATDIDELKALVSELLSLNQLDHLAALPRLEFAVAPLLRACLPPPGPQQFSASIGDALGELHGDPRLLARAINNLLGNAARYAPSRIVLSATRGKRLHIVIEDDGPGIPPQARERVFEPFYRLARDADHATPGYGLGLAIAARAIALHGGTLAVDDSPLGGARFTASLPACPQPARAVTAPR